MESAVATEFTSTVLNVPGRPGDWILYGEAYYQCVLSYAKGRTARGSKSGAGEIFLVQPRPGAHPASYAMGAVSFPGVKRPGSGVGHPSPTRAEVK